MSNPITAKQFFQTLYEDPNGYFLEIRRLPGGVQNFCQSIEQAVSIASVDRSHNIYFGVALRSDRKGDEAHAAVVPTLWADIDWKDFAGGKEAAAMVLASFEFPPSIVVETGHGWHCYWLLKEPVEVTAENRPCLRGLLLGLAEALGGDPACRDLSRILRVPGTRNLKDPKNPKPVEIIRWYPERRYNLSDFEPWAVSDGFSGGNGKIQAPAPPVGPEIRDGKRNATLMSLAGTMRRRGMGQEAITAALLEENASKCKPQLPKGEVHKIARNACLYEPEPSEDDSEEDEDQEKKERKSQADFLVDLALEDELFHDQTQTPYARVKVNASHQILRVQGRAYKRLLSHRMYEAAGRAPGSEALKTALNVIEAMACFRGAGHELHNRTARHDGAIWYDLTDERWRAVRVTSAGWQVIDAPPIVFIRYEHHAAQVEPIPGGDVHRIFDFIAVSEEGPRLLLLVYLVSCFVPDIPHPIPVLHGPQGSGKSSTFRIKRMLVDPSATETLSFPRDTNGLVQALSHHWCTYFDNVTTLQTWQSDALCRAVTGEGFSKRQLYTDDDDIIYVFRRCVGLNGINIAATRADLLDRSILIGLDRIPPDKRRTEEALWAAFGKARPHILGGVLDTLSAAMRLLPEVRLKTLPRMADFARWGCAIAQALGYTQEDFLRAYGENIEAQNDEILQGHPVAAAVVALMEDRTEWEGTPTELLTELEKMAAAEKMDTRAKAWPKAAHVLTLRLNEIRSNLVDAGIAVAKDRSAKRRTITVQRILENSVTGVTSVIPMKKQGFTRDASNDAYGTNSDSVTQASHAKGLKKQGDDGYDGNDATFPPDRWG